MSAISHPEFADSIEQYIKWASEWDGALLADVFFGVWADFQQQERPGGCTGCQNPLNGVDVDNLSICAIQNLEAYKALTAQELETAHALPCGHESVPPKELLDEYLCQECSEAYWYSFCFDSVQQASTTWHCEVCRQCRDWREWQCENCNKCTYGVTMPSQHCGNDEGVMNW